MYPEFFPFPECPEGYVVIAALALVIQYIDHRIAAIAGMDNSLTIQRQYHVFKVALRQAVTVFAERARLLRRVVHQRHLLIFALFRVIFAKTVKRVGDDKFVHPVWLILAVVRVEHLVGVKKGKILGDPLHIGERPPFFHLINFHV